MIRARLLLLSSLVVFAAGQPNFSGDWQLNLGQSEYGGLPAPESLQRKIRQAGTQISVDTVQNGTAGQVMSHYQYSTDEKPTTNKVQGGQATAKSHWEGAVLVIETERAYKGAVLKQTERWRLSSDRKIMMVATVVDVPTGKFQVDQAFEKQAPKK